MDKKRLKPFVVFAATIAVSLTSPIASLIAAEDVGNTAVRSVAEQRFDKIFFNTKRDRSVEITQSRLSQLFHQRIEEIDRCCGLTDVQKQKLELASQGGVRQIIKSIAELKQKFLSEERDDAADSRFLNESPELLTLKNKVRSGSFDEDSLFAKTLRNVLSPEQFVKYDERGTLATKSNKAITAANAVALVRTAKFKKDVHNIVWNRDGKHVAFVEFNKPVEIYLPPAELPVRNLGIGKQVVGFDFGPDENVVAIGENSEIATIMNLMEGSEIRLQTGQHQPSVKFSPDGKMLATGGYGTTATIWSTATGELVREFDVGPVKGGLTPVFSPDGCSIEVLVDWLSFKKASQLCEISIPELACS